METETVIVSYHKNAHLGFVRLYAESAFDDGVDFVTCRGEYLGDFMFAGPVEPALPALEDFIF